MNIFHTIFQECQVSEIAEMKIYFYFPFGKVKIYILKNNDAPIVRLDYRNKIEVPESSYSFNKEELELIKTVKLNCNLSIKGVLKSKDSNRDIKQVEEDFHVVFNHLLSVLKKQGLGSNIPYPYYIPNFFPYQNEKIFQEILKKREGDILFLNGKEGTGRFTFSLIFLSWHFSMSIDKKVVFPKDIDVFEVPLNPIGCAAYIPELAKLSIKKQEEILENLKSKTYYFIFFSSVYDINYLESKKLVIPEIVNECKNNLVPFSSNTIKDIPINAILGFWAAFNPDEINAKILSLSIYINNNNFTNLRREAGYYSSLMFFLEKFNEDKDNLEEIEKKLDMASISYAVSKVGKSQNKISEFLGISRGSLQHKLKKYNINYRLL